MRCTTLESDKWLKDELNGQTAVYQYAIIIKQNTKEEKWTTKLLTNWLQEARLTNSRAQESNKWPNDKVKVKVKVIPCYLKIPL